MFDKYRMLFDSCVLIETEKRTQRPQVRACVKGKLIYNRNSFFCDWMRTYILQ